MRDFQPECLTQPGRGCRCRRIERAVKREADANPVTVDPKPPLGEGASLAVYENEQGQMDIGLLASVAYHEGAHVLAGCCVREGVQVSTVQFDAGGRALTIPTPVDWEELWGTDTESFVRLAVRQTAVQLAGPVLDEAVGAPLSGSRHDRMAAWVLSAYLLPRCRRGTLESAVRPIVAAMLQDAASVHGRIAAALMTELRLDRERVESLVGDDLRTLSEEYGRRLDAIASAINVLDRPDVLDGD